jgi:hypothetical protein
MNKNKKPAAWLAAGSMDVLSWVAKHTDDIQSRDDPQERLHYLRLPTHIIRLDAAAAHTRVWREHPHAATAAIFDAWRCWLEAHRVNTSDAGA